MLYPRGLGGRERRAPQLRGHLGWQGWADASPLGLHLGSLGLKTEAIRVVRSSQEPLML